MKLLLVEDDRKIAAAVARGLAAEGFRVEVATDGDDGLWRATEGSYDLILLDLMLPKRSGFRVCADLRAAGDWTPILVLTAKDGELDETEALETGADDYLTKPFAFPVLVARVRALLRRAGDQAPPPVEVGSLRIDPGSRRVVLGDSELGLTAREFDVLEHLVRRAGQVVSKDELLARVWDDDFDGNPNIVEVYVGRLRRKLDEPTGPPWIETVRGAGYRLGAVSVRLRVTALATATVLAVLVVTGIALVVTQRRLLTDNQEDGLRRRADDVTSLVVTGRLPPDLGGAGDSDAVQVVTADGDVVAASANLAGARPIAAPPPAGVSEVLRTLDDLPVDDDPFRVLSRHVDGTDGPVVVHVATSTDDVAESVALLARSLVVAVPIVVALLAALTWWLVGRTLRPVDAAHAQQRRFVADAAHELRTPLARIRSEVEVDLAHPGSADLVATHRSVLEEVTGLEHLVDDLLHLARSDAGAAAGRHQPVDLDDLVLAQARLLREVGRVRVDSTGVGPARVLGDPTQLGRAIGNLADNAGRHAASTVTLTLAERDHVAVLVVADDGPGIKPADRERVFERFTRLDESRTAAAGGAGLGLAIARDIVERHGGTIVVDGEGGGGARLVMTMPTRAARG